MDSLHGFDAGRTAVTSALPNSTFPTLDEIDVYVRRAQRLRAEVTVAGLSTVFKALVRPLRMIGGVMGSWQERTQLKQALMRRSDRLLTDIGVERDGIDVFLRGEKPDRHPVDPPFELRQGLLAQIERNRQVRLERKRIESELMAYKDSELDDIGIHRIDIPEIARSQQKVAA